VKRSKLYASWALLPVLNSADLHKCQKRPLAKMHPMASPPNVHCQWWIFQFLQWHWNNSFHRHNYIWGSRLTCFHSCCLGENLLGPVKCYIWKSKLQYMIQPLGWLLEHRCLRTVRIIVGSRNISQTFYSLLPGTGSNYCTYYDKCYRQQLLNTTVYSFVHKLILPPG